MHGGPDSPYVLQSLEMKRFADTMRTRSASGAAASLPARFVYFWRFS
jgi:hypothetical protein